METNADVVIVGAGFSGVLLAHNLAEQGIRVLLLDRSAEYPNVLRAEKIEADQAQMLRSLDALDHRAPAAQPLGQTINYRNGVGKPFESIEQYGISYPDTVNNMRDRMLGNVELRIDEVTSISASRFTQRITTKSGTTISGRLIALCTGGNERLANKIGVQRQVDRTLRSLTVAFDLLSSSDEGFRFAGFNYFVDQNSADIDYLTLFRIGDRMRANLFTQWLPGAPELKRLSKQTKDELLQFFPDLEARIGPFTVAGKLQFFMTEYYRLRDPAIDGVVFVADEFQSVCPGTGTGLSKVVNDVDVLRRLIPQWLATEGMERKKISGFYQSAQKIHCDEDSHDRWIHYRDNAAPTLKRLQYRVARKVHAWFSLH